MKVNYKNSKIDTYHAPYTQNIIFEILNGKCQNFYKVFIQSEFKFVICLLMIMVMLFKPLLSWSLLHLCVTVHCA